MPLKGKKKPAVISIIIPVYNEVVTIREVIRRVRVADTLGLRKEIIVIDDGSTDGTAQILKKIPKIVLYTEKNNKGKGAAVRMGMAMSTGDIVLIQDADFEYSPDDYPKIIEPFLSFGANAVFGSRFRGSEARRVFYFSHQLANQFLSFLSDLMTNLNLSDIECGFKAFDRKTAKKIVRKLQCHRFGIEPELVARVAKIPGIHIFEIGVHYQGRTYSEGKKIGLIDGIKALFLIIYFRFTA